MLTNNGSVGISTLNPSEGKNSINGTDSGTQKIESIIALSRANNNPAMTIKATGRKLNK